MRSRVAAGVCLCGLALFAPVPTAAHTSLPAYLELTEVGPGSFDVVWRVPAVEGPPPAIYPVLPQHCAVPADPTEEHAPESLVSRGIVTCGDAGLRGHTIAIEGLTVTIMDVVVKIIFKDGHELMRVLRAQEPSFIVAANAGSRVDAAGYVRLGVDHILSGIDHLFFVLGLLLIVSGAGRLLKAVTAFTVAHSLTLGIATFGIVRLPTTPIEAVVALSIVFLAVEIAQHDRGIDGLTYRRPWVVAFAFGLLHGFGFAGTLVEIGISATDIPLALLFFNLGVEAGQLGFIAAAVSVFLSVRQLDLRVPLWVRPAPAYTIGSLASFWFLQRCVLMFAF